MGSGGVAGARLRWLGGGGVEAKERTRSRLGGGGIGDGGAWGFGLEGTGGTGGVGISRSTLRGAFERDDDARSAEALERHDASDAPEWVRRVAPFDDLTIF